METQQELVAIKPTRIQGHIADGRVVLSKDTRYVTVYFADGSKVREHRNRLLAILGEPFLPEPPQPPSDETPPTLPTGFIGKTRLLLSRDGQYLTIYFHGGRFTRHANYFRAVLGVAYEPASKVKNCQHRLIPDPPPPLRTDPSQIA